MTPPLKAGDRLYLVSDYSDGLEVESVVLKKVTEKFAVFGGRAGLGFGCRTQMRVREAERLQRTPEAAVAEYVAACVVEVNHANAKLVQARRFQERKKW